MRGLQPRGHYHQWGTAQSEDGSPQSDDDEDDDEELQNASPELLGTGADKKVLAGVLKRFSKDNLADESDSVVAAIRMQVRAVAPFRRLLNVVTTCGLWLLFQPREDSASLLLTKKGRCSASSQ
ncbi:unnamed protein product [Effrenium voratum]|uniref:Uncharacterized protein n=1 Tax=Effrenium voratum TaxID=2562239 RepID=A0AA36NJN6_9DINO|nr:unnamed protein product [Effrenium voratum]